MRLEAGPLLAWVSPCGGLLDFSCLDEPGTAPRPVLRRSPPAPCPPPWLAVCVLTRSLDHDSPAPPARLLDRSPLSARLDLDLPEGRVVARYELTAEGLLVGVTPDAAGRVAVRLDRATPEDAVEVRAGRGGPRSGPRAARVVSFSLDGPIELLIRPTPPPATEPDHGADA